MIDGIQAKRQWADTLRQIEARYGVKPNTFWACGVWSQTLGKRWVKSRCSVARHASYFDRRQSYFRGSANAQKIVQRGDVSASDDRAHGLGRLDKPSLCRQLILIWRSILMVMDAVIWSIACLMPRLYRQRDNRGYRSGEPWGYEVKIPAGYWGASDRKNKKSMSYWRDKGFTLADGRPLPYDLSSAGLLLPAGQDGPAFLVGKNFDAFYSYNASENLRWRLPIYLT